MFKDITIKGFRGISDVKFDDFKQFNLFVGKNSCCKTSVLESLFILVSPTSPTLPSKTNLFRGIGDINETSLELFFHNFDIEEPIKLVTNMDKIHKIRSLLIKPKIDFELNSDYQKDSAESKLLDERYFQSGEIQNINGLIFESSFLDMNNEEKTYVTEIFISIVGKNRIPQHTSPKDYNEKLNGIFISPEFYTLSQTVRQFGEISVRKRKDSIIKVLNKIEPLLTDMVIGPVNTIFCDIKQYKMLPINVMGGGINKILSVVLAIENNKDGVVLIDEIENGLSPSSQEILWKAIFATAKEFNVQIFATTHSLECIKTLSLLSSQKSINLKDDIRVYKIERQREDFRIVKYNQDNIALAAEKDLDIR
ncbi:MAG: AAA family ATPase [Candidatus Aminicenantes bacterium]|nr:AAA family ATPase [Candidatus Aminicenantes bacterium]